ncbi:1-deoxy-D-xylulose-5-phosphate reductoisomerase [Anoxybacter fermentans]|uniref:1-deoxy-D-xylulose 5-phosphate reductoisomerase n=1 Tax=Anoxybacter fermentans TaxID=1323375 RepID=A0A3S9SVS3_9FIRM|nr:1-deoxy-D-xylulose-5-phosphate reductoisomerase [Anoxybacter fermentans]AZR72379.1 1-deoxy-D-xylulose-5-phosphate reductoisomerase [Anoxybacter fermentans]
MKKIAILGSTGSIGTQTLEVVDQGGFEVIALSANSSVIKLATQALKYRPKMVVLMNSAFLDELEYRLKGTDIKVLAGMEGLIEAVTDPDVELIVNALVGAVGIRPTLEGIRAGKQIALANKETLVAAGELVMQEAQRYGIDILPIDSEHNAIFQALAGEDRSKISRLILTASGGPFRNYSREELKKVTPAQALKHPNWDMGGKITIDSATLMNKGLEVIEAHWLFGIDYDRIDVVVHPQSIVHSLVEFVDSSILAELGLPDMRVPIQYALTYPERRKNFLERLDLVKVGELTFEKPKRDLFPCLELAYQAGRRGGTLPAVMNAANEVAVAKFLNEEISFLEIPELIRRVMEKHQVIDSPDLNQILAADQWARAEIERMVEDVDF